MSEEVKVFLGDEQQADITLLAERVVAPLRQQLEEQQRSISVLQQQITVLENRMGGPQSMTEQLMTPTGLAAQLARGKKG